MLRDSESCCCCGSFRKPRTTTNCFMVPTSSSVELMTRGGSSFRHYYNINMRGRRRGGERQRVPLRTHNLGLKRYGEDILGKLKGVIRCFVPIAYLGRGWGADNNIIVVSASDTQLSLSLLVAGGRFALITLFIVQDARLGRISFCEEFTVGTGYKGFS